jgi:hypothetical protein
MMERNEMTQEIERILREASEARFWGDIQLEYKDGQVILIRKTETIKLTGTTEKSRRYEAAYK